MFFKTTEDHENLRMKIREFAETEVKPIAFMLDKENEFPTEAVKKTWRNGSAWNTISKRVWWSRIGYDQLCNRC